MNRRKKRWQTVGFALGAMVLSLMVWPGLAGGVAQGAFTSQFWEQNCTWKSRSLQNLLFPLRPGHQNILEGEEEDDGETIEIRVEVTVLRDTERIVYETPHGDVINVRTRVLEEREFEDGELVEVSRNFVALCKETSDIFYFGEDVDDYEDGEIVGHEGEWRAGVDGAVPGILFPGRFLLGAKYFQEIAPGVAEDRAQNADMGLEVPTDAGTFADCVLVIDSNRLDPDSEGDPKVYCPEVGLVMDEELILIEHHR